MKGVVRAARFAPRTRSRHPLTSLLSPLLSLRKGGGQLVGWTTSAPAAVSLANTAEQGGMKGLARFLKPYYLVHVAVLASYPLARHYAIHVKALKAGFAQHEDEVVSWEKQAYSLLAVIAAVKFVKRQSFDAFLSDVFMFAKVAMLFLALVMDIRVFSWYWACFVVIFGLIQQPRYAGPSKFTHFTPASLGQAIKQDEDGVTWLVEFHAAWSPPCIHLEPTMAKLSLKYSSQELRFGKLDLGRWPYVGKDYKISTSATSHQLPTLIMFEGGKEVARIPHVFQDGSFVKGRYREKDIVKGFDLEERLAMTRRKTTRRKKRA